MVDLIVGNKSKVRSIENLFESRNLLDDDTQRVLLPYIYETKLLLDEAIRKYDKSGFSTIIPSFDLGFTYNTGRLAGGFTTGMLLNLESNVPFIPIDITLKECSGSIIYIGEYDNHIENFIAKKIKDILTDLKKNGFYFNFNSGNHFITLCVDKLQKCYLVIHSGDDSYRNNKDGVYPSDNIWYKDDVKILFNKDNSRYIKYLVSESANKFIELALSKRNNVESFHLEIAKRIYEKETNELIWNTYQHYGLQSSHTAVLGVGLVPKNAVYPIFSNQGLPILLVRTSPDMWSIRIDGIEYYVFPHGWGQEIKNIVNIHTNYEKNIITYELKKMEVVQKIGYTHKLSKEYASIRTIERYSDIVNGVTSFESGWNNNFFGTVENVLFPVASYVDSTCDVIHYELLC